MYMLRSCSLIIISEGFMATMEKLEGSKVKLTIEIAADEFEKAVQEAYLKTRKPPCRSMESRPWTGQMFPSYPLNRVPPSFSRRKWL